MLEMVLTLVFFFFWTAGYSQAEKKISVYLLTQYNKTIVDQTKGNNPWGVGLGLQALFNNHTKFKPTVELTGDVYLENDKVGRLYSDGTDLPEVGAMTNLFAGASFFPSGNIYLSFLAGPSFINGETLFGIKPSLGFYFSKSKKWTFTASYINIFNRGYATGEDFGSISLAIGFRVF
jgi:hypothetical protein